MGTSAEARRKSLHRLRLLRLAPRRAEKFLPPPQNPGIQLIASGVPTRTLENSAPLFSRLGCADDAIANFPPTLDAGPRRSLRRGPPSIAPHTVHRAHGGRRAHVRGLRAPRPHQPALGGRAARQGVRLADDRRGDGELQAQGAARRRRPPLLPMQPMQPVLPIPPAAAATAAADPRPTRSRTFATRTGCWWCSR